MKTRWNGFCAIGRWGGVAAVLVAWCAGTVEAQVSQEQLQHLLAGYAKQLCSGVFVVGREPHDVIAHDLQRTRDLLSWDDVVVEVDRARRRVTLRAGRLGLEPRTAIHHGDQGAILLPQGRETAFFEPVEVESALPPAESVAWPMGDAEGGRAYPEDVDGEAVEAALDYAFDDESLPVRQDTRAMVIVHRGQVIGERYAEGFDRSTKHLSWSMGKSITAALVGILVGRGEFEVDDPAPIAEWHAEDDPRAAITISHLLRMSGGLDFNTGGAGDGTIYTREDHHRLVYFSAIDVFEHSIQRSLAFEPGTVWRYRNCDPLTLGKVIRDTVEAAGENYHTFPQRALFDRIGIRELVLETDAYGNFIMTGYEYGTARDWARFGLLHLQDGVWQGERVLPEGWVEYVRTPAPARSDEGYGGLFWLNRGGQFASLPRDLYWPAGFMGQVVMIVPSRELVVVRLGQSAEGAFNPYIEEVMGRILAAVPQDAR